MRLGTSLFAAGLALLPVSAANAQYCPNPLALPFCIAGAAVNTAATIATAPLYALSGPYYYYPAGYYYPGYYYPGYRRHWHRHRY